MKLQTWTETLKDGANLAEDFMASAEAVLVSVVGRVACWLTPLPSAVLVSRAAGRVFDLNGAWPFIMAAVVELVGLVTSNLWLTAKEWNANKRKSDPAANERLALGLLVGYFVTTIALLLAFEVPHVVETGNLAGLTSLLFPGLSAVGVIALNERVTHYRRVSEVEANKAKRRTGRTSTGRPKTVQNDAQEPTAVGQVGVQNVVQNGALDTVNASRRGRKAAILDAMLDIYLDNPKTGPTELARRLGIGRSTVYNYLDSLEEAGRISRDNGAVRVLEV